MKFLNTIALILVLICAAACAQTSKPTSKPPAKTPKPTSKPAVKSGPIKKLVKVDPKKEAEEWKKATDKWMSEEFPFVSLIVSIELRAEELMKLDAETDPQKKEGLLHGALICENLMREKVKQKDFKAAMLKHGTKSTSGMYYYYLGKFYMPTDGTKCELRDVYVVYNPTKVNSVAIKIEKVEVVDIFGDKFVTNQRGKVAGYKAGAVDLLTVGPVGGFIKKRKHMKVVAVKDTVIWDKPSERRMK